MCNNQSSSFLALSMSSVAVVAIAGVAPSAGDLQQLIDECGATVFAVVGTILGYVYIKWKKSVSRERF